MVLFHLLEHLRRSARTAFLFHTRCDDRGPSQADRRAARRIDRRARRGRTARRAARRSCCRKHDVGRRVVLIIDEAHNLTRRRSKPSGCCRTSRRRPGSCCRLSSRASRRSPSACSEPELAALTQRISTVARIGPLTESETLAYVKHRFKVGGRVDADLVDQQCAPTRRAGDEGRAPGDQHRPLERAAPRVRGRRASRSAATSSRRCSTIATCGPCAGGDGRHASPDARRAAPFHRVRRMTPRRPYPGASPRDRTSREEAPPVGRRCA